MTFLIEPVAALGFRARIYGVRYPASALAEIQRADIQYCGWIANFQVPRAFAEARMTVTMTASTLTIQRQDTRNELWSLVTATYAGTRTGNTANGTFNVKGYGGTWTATW